jgi:hypothetical protein
VISKFGRRVGDWLGLHCGDKVCRLEDPRHHGRIEAIRNSAFVKVRWNNDWLEVDIPVRDLRKVIKGEETW